ncbi:MAG: polyprenyl synthetase family protein, partial [Candidatus Zixiibacteriota bacterium]
MQTEVIDIQLYLIEKSRLVEKLLDEFIPPARQAPESLHQAMRYSVMAGGKRIRPILAFASFEYCGGENIRTDRSIEFAMAALEMIHTYSLIHDDLPCMDDDDLRRGQPTCHKKFGEATAVLAGDALHDIAFSLMARTGSSEVVIELANAIGTTGMIGGQIADVEAEGREVTRDEIVKIHNWKTGSLIRSSVRIGAMLAKADKPTLNALSAFGEKIGLAFQIIDDILDIEGTQELMGKKVGTDTLKRKATYPGVVGLKQARQDADRLIDEAINNLNSFGDKRLKHIALYIGQRE